MKGEIIILFFIILLGFFVSAEIIFNEQPNSVYNLGDSIFVPVTIKTLRDISGSFQMDLICNGTAINFYKDGVKLASGGEKNVEPSLVLIRNIIGNERGVCKIKAILSGESPLLSDNFKISDLLSIEGKLEKTEFDAGESVSITGKIVREDGENSNGFTEVNLFSDGTDKDVTQIGTITDGIFSMNISLPIKLKAGIYSVEMKAYEKDSDGIITNNGLTEYNIRVRQVPTNLEIIFENKDVMPDTSLKIKAVLHDQTGEQINSTVFITVKNSADKILEQREINTGEFLEYPIKSNELPAEWKVFAVSNKMTAEDKFRIKEKEEIKIEIINKTILITNIGNVFYNKTLLIKVDDTPLNIHVMLDVGDSRKYILSAPNGEYQIKVIAGNESEINEVISLTGDIIGIKEASNISFIFFFWIFLILILGTAVFIIFKRGYNKSFFLRIFSKKKGDKKMPVLGNLTGTGNKAELSLSIKGEKQDATVICLKIKNLKEIKSGKGSASESIQKLIEKAEEKKAVVYENQDYLFFILAPIKTKTFKNEKAALETAENIHRILKEHNKMFNQKINFGISLNYGAIVAKVENGIFKFMSMGSLITATKKIASLSHEEILLSDKINDSLRLQQVKTEKSIRDGTSVFIVTGIKKENEEARKFINRFMERQKKE